MPKNKGRGGKNYRRGKNENISKRQLEQKEEGQDYAHVVKMLGNGRLLCLCFGDGKQRLGHIRGKMKRKVWIQANDIVLVALRDFQDEKCDVILKYFPEEVKQLKNLKEIPENIQVNEDQEDHHQVLVEFQENQQDSDEDDDELDDEEEEEVEEEEEEEEEDEEEEEEEDDDEEQPAKKPQYQQPQIQPKQQQKYPQQQQQQNKNKADKEQKLTKADIDDI